MDKKLKQFLLRTGMPLEISVINKLLNLGYEDEGEIEYERDGKDFSTDILVFKDFNIFDKFYLRVNFVIECKYKEDNHNWFFVRFSKNHIARYSESSSSLIFDLLLSSYLLQLGASKDLVSFKQVSSNNFFELNIANKGIDVINNSEDADCDKSIINKAVNQAIFGAINNHVENIQFNFEDFEDIGFKSSNPKKLLISSMTIPLVVTTAKLHFVKSNVSLEEVRNSEDNISEEVPGLILDSASISKYSKYKDELFM